MRKSKRKGRYDPISCVGSLSAEDIVSEVQCPTECAETRNLTPLFVLESNDGAYLSVAILYARFVEKCVMKGERGFVAFKMNSNVGFQYRL